MNAAEIKISGLLELHRSSFQKSEFYERADIELYVYYRLVLFRSFAN